MSDPTPTRRPSPEEMQRALRESREAIERATALMAEATQHAERAAEIRREAQVRLANMRAIPQRSVPRFSPEVLAALRPETRASIARIFGVNESALVASGGWSIPSDLVFPSVATPPTTREERDAPIMLRSRDRDALALWADDLRYPLSSRPRRRSRRVDADDASIMSRRRQVARVVGDRENKPLVLLELSARPNRGIHRLITDLARSRHVGVAILPQAVAAASGVNQASLEVVAIGQRSSLFAANDVLLKALIPIDDTVRRREWEAAYEAAVTDEKAKPKRPEVIEDDLLDDQAAEYRTPKKAIVPEINGVPYASWRELPNSRSAYFISGFDANEFKPKWYFCELPPTFEIDESWSESDTMDAAFLSLKPESVILAEEMGYKVKRQGDMYAIPMKTPPLGLTTVAPRAFLFRSNHRADHVAYIGDEVYARGKIDHRPLDRRADHGPLRLGRRWHRIVKNTVPVAK